MIDVVTTLYALGMEGNLSGDEYVAHCPMHLKRTGSEDVHPSWSINIRTGLFNCFSCGYRGSVITLIADVRGVDFDVAKTMTIKPSMQTSVDRIPGAYINIPRPAPMQESRLSGFSVPPKWAKQRRKLSTEACDLYGVRWDYSQDMWIIPIRDPHTDELMGWQEKSETERVFRNYPTGIQKSRCLFGYNIFAGGRMIVVESPLDAVRLHSAGHVGAVATYGAIVSKAQILLMGAADEVVFALDNPFIDTAGKKASIELLTETKGVLRSVRFFDYTGVDAKDPGDMTTDQIASGIKQARSRAYGEKAVMA